MVPRSAGGSQNLKGVEQTQLRALRVFFAVGSEHFSFGEVLGQARAWAFSTTSPVKEPVTAY